MKRKRAYWLHRSDLTWTKNIARAKHFATKKDAKKFQAIFIGSNTRASTHIIPGASGWLIKVLLRA